MQRRGFIAAATGLSLGASGRPSANSVAAVPPKRVKPATRSEATAIIANARKITTPNGVERLETLRIGGIDQWVSVRGADRKNPVLLHIHGGPGYISIPMSWWFSRGWEEYFTVVQWDQRATGKTYLLTDPATVVPSLTNERMINDAEEMAAWARKTFGKDKIFVSGHSWGSYLGLELARRHPDWLHAYIGVGQMTDMPESERRGWRYAMDAARREGNAQAIRDLESIAPYAPAGQADSAEGHLHSAPMGGVLRRHDGVSARQRCRGRPWEPVTGLHRCRNSAYLGGQCFRRALPAFRGPQLGPEPGPNPRLPADRLCRPPRHER
jgi:pimeloyl-ACP methyl ester carboxylesterase